MLLFYSGLNEELINSSWCGVLAALSLLLDASTDETATESILKSIQGYASLCGKLTLNISRDAFITSLCKSSLPPHYMLTVLNHQSSGGVGSPAINIAKQGKKKKFFFIIIVIAKQWLSYNVAVT